MQRVAAPDKSKQKDMEVLVRKEQAEAFVASKLRLNLQAEKLAGEVAAAAESKKAPKAPLRQANKEVFCALDTAMQDMDGFGLEYFEFLRKPGALPPGATRYFIRQECELTGANRDRACIEEKDGASYFEVPMTIRDGRCAPPAHGPPFPRPVCIVVLIIHGRRFNMLQRNLPVGLVPQVHIG